MRENGTRICFGFAVSLPSPLTPLPQGEGDKTPFSPREKGWG
jgi:hypothetical protein